MKELTPVTSRVRPTGLWYALLSGIGGEDIYTAMVCVVPWDKQEPSSCGPYIRNTVGHANNIEVSYSPLLVILTSHDFLSILAKKSLVF